ncbi:rod shape-determining protein [Alkalibacter mobilis]|uniref:rod shape-determining protein n=1 Tax=Alkalibacter mobilis TaxID=2787712 RepID=UPI0022B60BEC|nr:rod shape-determining protein [Alkalibacter mobilis]
MGIFSKSYIGIDLGTANTLVAVKGKGIIIREPSVVAIDKNKKEVIAVGIEAKRMIGKTPGNIVAVRPLKEGVIADFNITQKMLKYFMGKAMKGFNLSKPRVLIGIPSDITEVERKAVIEAAQMSGAKEVGLIEEALATAIGAGLPVNEPTGSMVVDIGGGTTDIAVISLGGMVVSNSVRIGGDDFDEAIIQYIKNKHNLMIGDRTAEMIKISIASASGINEDNTMEIKGRDLVSGLPKTVVLDERQVYEAIRPTIFSIIDKVKSVLEKTPPELLSDILNGGIALTGGGAFLSGLDELISQETGVECYVANDPLDCVAKGTEMVLEQGYMNIIFSQA